MDIWTPESSVECKENKYRIIEIFIYIGETENQLKKELANILVT